MGGPEAGEKGVSGCCVVADAGDGKCGRQAPEGKKGKPRRPRGKVAGCFRRALVRRTAGTGRGIDGVGGGFGGHGWTRLVVRDREDVSPTPLYPALAGNLTGFLEKVSLHAIAGAGRGKFPCKFEEIPANQHPEPPLAASVPWRGIAVPHRHLINGSSAYC